MIYDLIGTNLQENDSTEVTEQSSSETTQSSNSHLNIDTDVLGDRQNTYTSVVDLYSIDVFSNNTFEIDRQLAKDKMTQTSILEHKIFVTELKKENNDIVGKLFATTTDTAIKENTQNNNNSNLFIGLTILLIAMLFLSFIFGYSQKLKKRRLEYVNNINDNL